MNSGAVAALGFVSLACAAAAALGAAAGCSRTPPEPVPAASTSHATSAAATVAAKSTTARCIAETPADAPKIPPPAPASACPPDPEPAQALPSGRVGFPDAPGSPQLEVEIAKTPHDLERGLMFRRAMDADHGMLFRLGERKEQTFWMHNTCIPLDMLFVDDDGTIVGNVEGAAPLTDSTRSVGCPSSWVLEVNGGWTRQHGVKAGQHLGIPAVAR